MCAYLPVINSIAENLGNERNPAQTDVYSQEAVDMYRYIQNHTQQDAVIAFHKPRILYLNTGRVCFRTNSNGHVLEEADYYVYSAIVNSDTDKLILQETNLELYFKNDLFSLYKLVK